MELGSDSNKSLNFNAASKITTRIVKLLAHTFGLARRSFGFKRPLKKGIHITDSIRLPIQIRINYSAQRGGEG